LKRKSKIVLVIIIVIIVSLFIWNRGTVKFALTHKSWDNISYENFIIYYPPDYQYSEELNTWAKERYLVFCELLDVFRVEWPDEKVITFYVFNDFENGRDYGLKLGFALRRTNTIYTRYNQTRGHELVHIVTNYLNSGHFLHSSLINEGIAVCYDFSDRDFDELSRFYLFNDDYEVDIFGDNFREHQYAYYFGGSFVKYLINTYSMDKFLEFYSQDGLDESESFIEYYGKDQKTLYNEWVNYLKGG